MTAGPEYVAESEWRLRRYLDVSLLGEWTYRMAYRLSDR